MEETREALEARESTMFTVPGKPRGKGRPRFRRAGNFVQTYTPAETASYENLIALEYQAAGGKLLDGPVDVVVFASFTPPKSTSKKNREAMLAGEILPNCKPDADNILKAVLDGLNGVAYKDDTQVAHAQVSRYYRDTAHLEVWVEPTLFGRFLK